MNVRSLLLLASVSLTVASVGSSTGCSSDSSAVATASDAGATPLDASACVATQDPESVDACGDFVTLNGSGATPVTTKCLPPELAGERAKSTGFGEFADGTYVLSEAYDLAADCATNPKTLTEVLRSGAIVIQTATSWTARADGATGKTTANYYRIPQMPVDAGADAAVPLLTTGDSAQSCPPQWPQVNCVEVRSFYHGGFFTGSATELRVYRNTTGNGQVDGSTAQLFAVYKKMP